MRSVLSVVILSIVLVTSCGGNDDDNPDVGPPSMVGTWEAVSSTNSLYTYRASDPPLITWLEGSSVPSQTDLTFIFSEDPNVLTLRGSITFESLVTNNRGSSQTRTDVSSAAYLQGSRWEIINDEILRIVSADSVVYDHALTNLSQRELEFTFERYDTTNLISPQDTSLVTGTYLFARK